jgi:hypothetical protein
MAGIDKTYIKDYESYKKYYEWCSEHDNEYYSIYRERLTDYFYDWKESDFIQDKSFPACNTPLYADIWLIKNCPIDFVSKRLKEQYGDEYYAIKKGVSKYDLYKREDKRNNTRFKVEYGPFGKIKRPKLTKNWWIENFNVEWRYDGIRKRWINYLEACPCYDYETPTAISLKSLFRKIRKWNLPKGFTLHVEGVINEDRMIIKIL